MPSHLRDIARGYDLESWVKNDCDLDALFGTVHMMDQRLASHHATEAESSDSDEILVNLVANLLNVDGALEDYVFEKPVSSHSLSAEGAMVPVLSAAGFLVVRGYRAALASGAWAPKNDEGGSA